MNNCPEVFVALVTKHIALLRSGELIYKLSTVVSSAVASAKQYDPKCFNWIDRGVWLGSVAHAVSVVWFGNLHDLAIAGRTFTLQHAKAACVSASYVPTEAGACLRKCCLPEGLPPRPIVAPARPGPALD